MHCWMLLIAEWYPFFALNTRLIDSTCLCHLHDLLSDCSNCLAIINYFLFIDSWPAMCIHGDKSQPERDWVLKGKRNSFKLFWYWSTSLQCSGYYFADIIDCHCCQRCIAKALTLLLLLQEIVQFYLLENISFEKNHPYHLYENICFLHT